MTNSNEKRVVVFNDAFKSDWTYETGKKVFETAHQQDELDFDAGIHPDITIEVNGVNVGAVDIGETWYFNTQAEWDVGIAHGIGFHCKELNDLVNHIVNGADLPTGHFTIEKKVVEGVDYYKIDASQEQIIAYNDYLASQ